jgi:hypothetical protein
VLYSCFGVDSSKLANLWSSTVAPVTTPVDSAVDNDPTASGSKEVTNRTGSILHDKGDERPHDEAIIITNELPTSAGDLLLFPRIKRSRWANLKPKETSQRLTGPLSSAIMDGTVSPFITNNKRLEKKMYSVTIYIYIRV